MAGKLASSALDITKDALDCTKDVAKALTDGAGDVVKGITDTAGEIGTGLFNGLKDLGSSALDMGGKALDGIKDFFGFGDDKEAN